MHHLLREALAHLVLVLAAVLEEGGEPLGAGQREEALLGEEEAEGGEKGAPGGEAHVRGAEVHPAGAFAARGGDEAERDAVEEQAGRNPGAPEQAFGAALGRSVETARSGAAAGRAAGGGGNRRVEVLPGIEHLHEKLPRRLAAPRVALANGEVGAQGLSVVREGYFELRRNRSFLRAGIPLGREAPAEDGGGECAEVGEAGLRAARGVELPFAEAAGQPALPFRIPPVQDRSRLRERRGGDHQAVRLDEAEPFEVGAGVGAGGGHRSIRPDTAAEVFRLKQLPVFGGVIPAMFLVMLCRVYLSLRFLNYFGIHKIILQPAIVGVEKACPTHQGKGENMFIIGRQKPVSNEGLFTFTDQLVPYLPYSSTSPSSLFTEPSSEIPILCQLHQIFPTDDKSSSITVQPVPELHTRFSLLFAKYLEGYIGVDNRTHQ